jgi:hypothetical protein
MLFSSLIFLIGFLPLTIGVYFLIPKRCKLRNFFLTIMSLFTGVLEYGVYGLVIAQIISQIVYNVWRWSMMVHKELQYSYIDTFRYGTAELLQFVSKKEKR